MTRAARGGLWRDAGRRLRRSRAAVAAAAVLGALVLACVLVPWLSAYRYDSTDLALGPTPPGWAHWMGTDDHGRDLLARVAVGGRVSLTVSLVATAASFLVGVTWGGVAGYVGGWVDAAMMRLVDALYAIPFLVVAVLVTVFFGGDHAPPHRLFRAVLGVVAAHPDDAGWFPVFRMALVVTLLGAISWLTMARIARGQVLALRGLPFVEAARALGAGHAAVIVRHLLPNAVGPLLVQAMLTIPDVMMSEAFLSFLGLGTQEPLASWGQLAGAGAETMVLYPWQLVFPALAMAVALLAFNVLGDGLRDALDPRGAARRA
jgi:oligopeptide transport system permease protein